jgi:3-oxoacyl-[acyl-carrier protein] reductase/meso-butanediol dehydrogenase/(S,S)-butanediol dehydrogenase/diacetyl reductase
MGIGNAITQLYLKEGYQVISVSRNEFNKLSDSHHHICCDLSKWDDALQLGIKIASVVDGVDVLINNVGRSEWKSIEEITPGFFNELFSLNVGSYFSVIQTLLPFFKNNSVITNISSMAGKRGSANNSIYSATKFAINGMTQSLAKELGPRGIRVNALCPVLVRSIGLEDALIKMGAPAHDCGVEEFLNNFALHQAALGRLPTALEVANFAFFLSSDRATSITGQCINVDCGVFPQ